MTSDSGGEGGGKSPLSSLLLEARYTRDYNCILSRDPPPAQRGGSYDKSLTVAAAVVAYCVFPLSTRRVFAADKEDEEYRSTLGLHRVGSQQFHLSVEDYENIYIYKQQEKTRL